MGEIFLAGRILVGGYYLFSAFHHFADTSSLARYAAMAGVPMPQVAVIVSGLLLLIGGLSLLLGIYPDEGIAALVLFFVPVTVMMHAFWADRDPVMRQMDIVNFGKNVGLLGSSLMLAAVPRPWEYSLERRAHLPVKAPV
ncbi:MAG TPA: DoxX family membrane protein [Polyangia bacterium]|nr:DoxX family membrane protein [Polyangia bacterium]